MIEIWKSQGKTIIVAEHRLYYLADLIDRAVYLQDGRIAADFSGQEMKLLSGEKLKEMGLRPFELSQYPIKHVRPLDNEVITLSDFNFAYQKGKSALNIPSLVLPKHSVIALIGHNGAGKSTLLNLLTGADVLAEDKLFATLDPTSRAIELPDGRSLLLVDTVGLIRRLPHHLVEAFKSTLEESACADIIIHVCDVSDPEAAEKADVTLKTLADLGAAEIPVVTVLNKCDLLTENIPEDDSTVKISAKKAQGIDRLLKVVAANLPETAKRMKLLLPYDKAGFTAKLRENGKVFTEEYTETGVLVDALVDQMLIKQMSQYETE